MKNGSQSEFSIVFSGLSAKTPCKVPGRSLSNDKSEAVRSLLRQAEMKSRNYEQDAVSITSCKMQSYDKRQ